MKKTIFTLMLTFSINLLFSQSLIPEKCNWKDVELFPFSDSLQANEVIVGTGDILSIDIIEKFEDITPRQLKEIKKSIRKFKSCRAYVDYDHDFFDKDLNPELTDEHLTILTVLKRDIK